MLNSSSLLVSSVATTAISLPLSSSSLHSSSSYLDRNDNRNTKKKNESKKKSIKKSKSKKKSKNNSKINKSGNNKSIIKKSSSKNKNEIFNKDGNSANNNTVKATQGIEDDKKEVATTTSTSTSILIDKKDDAMSSSLSSSKPKEEEDYFIALFTTLPNNEDAIIIQYPVSSSLVQIGIAILILIISFGIQFIRMYRSKIRTTTGGGGMYQPVGSDGDDKGETETIELTARTTAAAATDIDAEYGDIDEKGDEEYENVEFMNASNTRRNSSSNSNNNSISQQRAQ
jgi:hypothetical protein